MDFVPTHIQNSKKKHRILFCNQTELAEYRDIKKYGNLMVANISVAYVLLNYGLSLYAIIWLIFFIHNIKNSLLKIETDA